MSSEPFDFDAFINGTSLARRTVSAYRVDNRDHIARLTAEHDAVPTDSGDERESSTTNTSRKALADSIATLRAEMEASRVDWVIRTLGPEEFKAIRDDDEQDTFDQVSLQSRTPEGCPNPSLYRDLPQLTADQWRKIASVIGARQWGEIVENANGLILSQVAVPDFSRSVSATLSPQASSESSGQPVPSA